MRGSKNGHQKYTCLKKIGSHDQILYSSMGSNSQPIRSFKRDENLHFDHEQDMNTRSKNHEDNGHGLVSFLLIELC